MAVAEMKGGDVNRWEGWLFCTSFTENFALLQITRIPVQRFWIDIFDSPMYKFSLFIRPKSFCRYQNTIPKRQQQRSPAKYYYTIIDNTLRICSGLNKTWCQ